MSDKESGPRRKGVLELILTFLAVISGSVAAIGAFLAASYDRERVELERRPAVHLACQPEFRALDVAEGVRPPTNNVLLTSRGARWIHVVGDGRVGTPQAFAKCTLTSYGQLPVFNLRLTLWESAPRDTRATLDIPGLSPSASYSFGIVNGAGTALRFHFEPSLGLTRVDTGTADVTTLFMDQGLLDLQGASSPRGRSLPPPPERRPRTGERSFTSADSRTSPQHSVFG